MKNIDCYSEEYFGQYVELMYSPPTLDEAWLDEPEWKSLKDKLERQKKINKARDCSKLIDKLPENIGPTNPPLPTISYDNYSLTEIYVLVSGGDVRLHNDVEWVWRNYIYPQFVPNTNPHHIT